MTGRRACEPGRWGWTASSLIERGTKADRRRGSQQGAQRGEPRAGPQWLVVTSIGYPVASNRASRQQALGNGKQPSAVAETWKLNTETFL